MLLVCYECIAVGFVLFLLAPQIEIFFQLLLAATLGAFIGMEREYRRKEAGLRTYSLVCLGAALFTILGSEAIRQMEGVQTSDPSRIVGQIVLGIGFLGAGLIILRHEHLEGLTTAAGLWVTAAIGTAVGIHLYFVSIFASLLSVLVLAGLRKIEERLFKTKVD